MDGRVDLVLGLRGSGTVLERAHQEAPCRVLFPRAEAGEPHQSVLVNISGGLVGGDRISQTICVRPDARAAVTTQAAEKIYRTAGPPVLLETVIAVPSGARLEWMPQPTILFNGSALQRRTRIELETGSFLLAGEILILGRHARGERLTTGTLRDRWDIAIDGAPVWSDRLRVDDWEAVRDAAAGFDGAQASALAVIVARDAPAQLDEIRVCLSELETPAAATVLGGLLIIRWLGPLAAALVRDYAAFWAFVRATMGFGAGRIPKIWQV